MRNLHDKTKSHTARRGFNLVEAAIVLGVIGLVIGGIWVAASTVNERYKINTMMESMSVTIANVANLFGSMPLTVAPPNFQNSVIAANLVPETLIKNGALATPWGGNMTMSASTTEVSVVLYGLSRSACIQIARRLNTITAYSWVQLNGTQPSNSRSTADVDTDCGRFVPASMGIAFGIRGMPTALPSFD